MNQWIPEYLRVVWIILFLLRKAVRVHSYHASSIAVHVNSANKGHNGKTWRNARREKEKCKTGKGEMRDRKKKLAKNGGPKKRAWKTGREKYGKLIEVMGKGRKDRVKPKRLG